MKNRFTISILIALDIVLILFTALFLIGRDVGIQAENITSIKDDLKTRSQQLSDLARLREEAKLTQPDLAKLEAAVPKKDELFSVRRELEELAAKHSLSVNFSFGSENSKENSLASINFGIKLVGGDFNIRSFINEVEARHPFVKIASLDMVRQENDFSADLKGRILFKE